MKINPGEVKSSRCGKMKVSIKSATVMKHEKKKNTFKAMNEICLSVTVFRIARV